MGAEPNTYPLNGIQMATTATRPSKIERLEALIDHPRTPENERAAAQAMLTRILEKAVAEGRKAYADSRWYGEKYDRIPKHAPTKDIAAAIREEIKLARKIAKQTADGGDIKLFDPIGDAPAEIKYSVRVPHYGSITIEIKNIPHAWGWVAEDRNGYMGEFPTEALRTLGRELKSVMNAYNHDGSDLMTDYFDVRFYGSVRAENGCSLGY